MSRPVLAVFVLSVSLLTWETPACSQDWNHWRGSTGNGGSVDATPPTKWSDTENVKWKVEIPGRGSGSPVISGDKVFVVSAVETAQGIKDTVKQAMDREQEKEGRRGRRGREPVVPAVEMDFKVFCFDRSSGQRLWEKTANTATPHEGTHSTNGFASASPCTDGQHVYASFGSRGVYCYTMDGDLVWKRDDFGEMQTRNSFGEGSSPMLYEDKLILPWDHEGLSLIHI